MRKNHVSSLMVTVVALCGPVAAHAQTAMTGEQVYQQVCFACHAAGLDKAPKFGDRKIWSPLLREGQAKLTADGWVGERGMPAKGGKADLSLDEFSRAVAYMARAGGANWKDPDAAMLASIGRRASARLDSLKAKK